MIIIGPALNTGIGQLSKKYTRLFGNESVYHVFGEELPQWAYLHAPNSSASRIRQICKETYKKPSLYDHL